MSVIVPFYNGKKYLASCLECLDNQTYRHLEIIFVDDGSTDQGGEMLRTMIQGRMDARLIRKENSGLSDSRRVGFEASHGKYVYFLDVDDFLLARAIETAVWAAENNQLDITAFGSMNVSENTPVIREIYELEQDNQKPSPYRTRNLRVNRIYGGMEFVKASLASEDGLYAPVWLNLFSRELLAGGKIPFVPVIHEDLLFTIDALLEAKRVGYVDQVLHIRRISSGSLMTGRKTARHVEGAMEAVRHAIRLYDTYSNRADLRPLFRKWIGTCAWLVVSELRACPFEVRWSRKWSILLYFILHLNVLNPRMLLFLLL